jgi:hypothetical protein
MRKFIASMLATIAIASPAAARRTPRPVWEVTRTSDPITGATSCIVAVYDQTAGMSLSRIGVLYPLIENSSVHGLLVGVSSGGRFRLPTGDILWRVDDLPFRTLRAADNPTGVGVNPITAQASAAMQQLVDEQRRLIMASTATSTVTSGDTARAMLGEMLAGQGLVYRQAAQTTSYGLPGNEQAVGQITREGLRPIPLDDSLRAGLATCGIEPG